MNNKYGFTLVELLTVVIILSILTAIAVPQYTKAVARATAANALISLKTVFDASKRYYSTHDQWPTSFVGLDTKLLLNDGSTDTSGEFKYTFDAATRSVSANLVVPGETDHPYWLTATYRTAGGKRDEYTCQSASDSGKFRELCESLCAASETGNPCVIK